MTAFELIKLGIPHLKGEEMLELDDLIQKYLSTDAVVIGVRRAYKQRGRLAAVKFYIDHPTHGSNRPGLTRAVEYVDEVCKYIIAD